MGMWTAIAMICVAGIIGEAYRSRHKAGNSKESAERIDALENRLQALEGDLRERVEVLERIVTDRQADLKRQFEHLDKAS